MGDRHELGQSRSAKECLVWAFKVHHLKPGWLSAKMIFVSEEDVYLDLADWGAGKARHNAVENSSAALKLFLLDS